MSEAPSLGTIWEGLQPEITTCIRRFQSEIESAAKGLSALVDTQSAAFKLNLSSNGGPGRLEPFKRFTSETADRLLFRAVDAYRGLRPQERALTALEHYQTFWEDLPRRLPAKVSVQGLELLSLLPPGSESRLQRFLLQRRRSALTIRVRSVVEGCVARESAARNRVLGEYFLALAKASLIILVPWQATRREILRVSVGSGEVSGGLEESRALWVSRSRQLQAEVQQASEALSRACAGMQTRVASALVHRKGPPSERTHARWLRARRNCVRYWFRQHRAVRAVLDLECDLTQAALGVTAAGETAVSSLELEQRALLKELDGVVAWLEEAQQGGSAGDFPPPQATLLSGEERAGDWQRCSRGAAERNLPDTIETVVPRYARPPWRSPWRIQEPRKIFLSSLDGVGTEPVRAAFREAEEVHRNIVREIERAREVVRFSLEAAGKDESSGQQVIEEGLANALALVSFRRQSAANPHEFVERSITGATCAVVSRTHAALDQGRLGLLAHLLEQSGARLVRDGWGLALEKTSGGGRLMRDAARAGYHRILQRAGWEAPSLDAAAPVGAQAHLGDILYLRPPTRDLPMIYQRLFRLAPVEEPRFLVGREPEMAALAQARSLWEARRFVSVVIVGARGSGKTSLLNCVSAAGFRGAPVVRGQFQRRITGASEMRTFLHELLGLAAEDDLAAALENNPRVIMLEEVERSFLRTVNGFEGLRELLAVISATGRTALWMLSLNQHSYRYLDAAVHLSRHFTHQINAMAVPPRDLQSAILLRHYLSGLRLEYPPLPESDPRASRMRRMLGLEQSPEDRFFDSLYRQSEGVFRSAFELWQNYMDRVEGGVLYMREPLEPNFDKMIGQLTLEDALTLQSVLQHGNLTGEEHAQIFDWSAGASRTQLERLAGLEYLEPEPSSPGLRIRPEAGRLVHMALHRLNLI